MASGCPNCGYIRSRGLTKRQIEVAEALLDGLSNEDIGKRTNMAMRTAKAHLANLAARVLVGDHGIKRVRLAVALHEQRHMLGIRCAACGEM
jgi:DNA-binding NarL/FixJ family response regulator